MDILLLSSMCSQTEQKRIFNKYGSLTSYASQRFNRLMVAGLISNGANVTCLSHVYLPNGATENRPVTIENEGKTLFIYLPMNISRLKTIIEARRQIRRWCKQHKDGVIICDTILGELSIALNSIHVSNERIALVTDVPTVRANDHRIGIKRIPILIKQNQLTKFDGYIFLTEQMNGLINKKNRKYTVVEGFAEATYESIEPKYHKTCMMAGLLENEFGVKFLLDAFSNMKIDDAKLFFYGRGTAVEEIKEYSNRDSRIQYMGELPNNEIVREEKKCTLLINPRPNDQRWTAYSFPSKNIEYISSGTPMVAFKLDGMPDEYRDYFYAIPSQDVNDFSNMLGALLSMKDEIHSQFGLKAKEWIVANKNPYKQARKIVMLLEEK